jgi:His/Glu/Gln/Arg/opine family amino acid ABC transporter permease subunit
MEFDIHIFWEALTSSQFLHGALITVLLAVFAQITATAIGFLLALGRVAHHPAVRWLSSSYVWFFRAMPALLVLLFIWNALPQLVPAFKESWFTAFMAGYIGLSIAEGAYMAEILRSALLAVDPGQKLAGRALGMTPWQILRKVTLPQVVRVALPPTGNELVTLLKLTSLTSVISLRELLTVAGQQVSTTFHFAEIYAAAAVYYLAIVSVMMIFQARIERRYSWRTRPVRSTVRRPRLRMREQRAL